MMADSAVKIMQNVFTRFFKDESGTTAIEYALIAALIFLAIVTSIHYYTDQTGVLYTRISNAVTGVTN
jgi:pilus assembly protein Flp/PilA